MSTKGIVRCGETVTADGDTHKYDRAEKKFNGCIALECCHDSPGKQSWQTYALRYPTPTFLVVSAGPACHTRCGPSPDSFSSASRLNKSAGI